MSNFITSNKWPPRRIVGVVLTVIGIFYQAPIFSRIVRTTDDAAMLGMLLAIVVWGYILFLLLQASDEARAWKGIPHSCLAIMLYLLLVMLAGGSMGGYTPIQ